MGKDVDDMLWYIDQFQEEPLYCLKGITSRIYIVGYDQEDHACLLGYR